VIPCGMRVPVAAWQVRLRTAISVYFTFTCRPILLLQPAGTAVLEKNRCKAKPVGSPPGYPNVNWSVYWFACVQRITSTSCRTPPSTERHANPIPEADKTNKNWLPRQRPLRDQILTSYRSSTATQPCKFGEDRPGDNCCDRNR